MSREADTTAPPWPPDDPEIQAVLRQAAADGSWGRYHGPHCDALRLALAEFHDVSHVRLCSSGTVAVELALRGAQVTAGDEVLLAAYDYKANFVNVVSLGAVPVLIDNEPHRPVVSAKGISRAVTPKTKAIVCSHLHGCLADIRRVRDIAVRHGITVIEDACQVPGARIGSDAAGTLGDVGVLSFGGSKLLTAGRGGAVLTSDAAIAQRIRLYCERGNDAYPLSEIQAALLLPQLGRLNDRNAVRLASAEGLADALKNDTYLTVPAFTSGDGQESARSSFYKFPLMLRNGGAATALRDSVSDYCRSHGVALDPGFAGLHRIHSRRRFRAVGALPNANELSDRMMTLHHPVLLGDDRRLQHAVAVIHEAVSRARRLSADDSV